MTIYEKYLEDNLDVSTPEKLAEFMSFSKNVNDWNIRCDIVKKVCNDYPSYWFETIILSGLYNRVRSQWSNQI